MPRRSRHVGVLVAVVATLAIAFPLGVLAAITFSDVPPGHPFYYDIQAVAEKGVTTGCGGGKYCPDAYVTRGQMAAFMNRLGALGTGKTPVANADKLDGFDAADLARPVITVGHVDNSFDVDPDPNESVLRVWMETGSESKACLATLGESTPGAVLDVLYCSERSVTLEDGQTHHGAYLTLFLDSQLPDGDYFDVNVYQEGAASYGAPRICDMPGC